MRCDRVVTLDQFHGEGGHAPAFFEAVDVSDVRMVQRGQRLRLALETRKAIRIVRERLGQDLDRDVAIELGITRPIDFAHAAHADLRGDFVGADAGAWAEGHTY